MFCFVFFLLFSWWKKGWILNGGQGYKRHNNNNHSVLAWHGNIWPTETQRSESKPRTNHTPRFLAEDLAPPPPNPPPPPDDVTFNCLCHPPTQFVSVRELWLRTLMTSASDPPTVCTDLWHLWSRKILGITHVSRNAADARTYMTEKWMYTL